MNWNLPKLVLFDLDGTMVDSVPDLSFSLDRTLETLGIKPRGIESARRWVGNGVERLVKRGLTDDLNKEPDPELFQKAIVLFRRIYSENTSQRSTVYPGVFRGLKYLERQGVHRACVTNKAEQFTRPLLEALGLAPYMELTICGDTLPKSKPDPMPLLHASAFFSADTAECIMVGDSVHDVQAAKAAGYKSVAVPYGYNHGNDISLAGPHAIIDSIGDLQSLFSKD